MTQIKKMKSKLTPVLLAVLLIVQAFLPIQVFLDPPRVGMREASAAAPIVVTVPAVVLKDNVKLYGNLTDLGGFDSNNVYFEWGTDTNYNGTPTASTSQTSIGIFSDTISRTGLVVGTIYHFRACAYNVEGPSYGSDTTFVIGNVFEVHPSESIQTAIDTASAGNGDVVYVHAGTYEENVNIAKANLTVEGQGRDDVTVNAAVSSDHVFDVTADYVNISGFTVTGATGGWKGGIYLGSGVDHCNIASNSASNNKYGIYLSSSSDNNLTSNTANSNNYYGIWLHSSSDNNLTSNTANSNIYYGIYLYSSSDNNTFTSNIASNNQYGINLCSSSYNTFVSNTANSNIYYGIYLYSSSYNTFMSNTANSNSRYGIYLSSSSDNNLTSNTANSNIQYGIYLSSSSDNNLTSNAVSNNLHALSYLQTDSQEGTTGNQIDFNFTMKDTNDNDCPTCSYNLDLFPAEANLQYSPSGATITGNFTPTRKGIYSLRVNVTDIDGNSETRKYIYLIDAASLNTSNYYFRQVLATHGQIISYGTDHDAGSFLFDLPDSEECIWCDTSVGFSVDRLPDNLFGIIKDANYSIWYQTNSNGDIGIQRYNTIPMAFDLSIPVSATSKTFDTFSFTDINWANDYFWSGYWFTVILIGGNPYIYSTLSEPSKLNITYLYSTTPAIKSISNEDVLFLSATSPTDNTNNATVVLGGTGTTNLTIQMPNTATDYTVEYDSVSCDDDNLNCSFFQSEGELSFTLTLGSEHTLGHW